MAKYKIRIYKLAKHDLEGIIDYINSLSQTAALKQYDHFIEKIGSLSEMPERCALLKDPHLQLRGYRTLIVDNYLVFFVIKGDTVQIRRILYGRRNYEWLL